jgi:hypothetical protein
MRPLFFVTVLVAATAFAADRPELNGTWQLSATHEGKLKFETLLIHQNADSIKITESGAKEQSAEFACGSHAQECKVADGTISFWYNGPALVMMESHHNRDVVTKTRLMPAGDGKTLSLEVTRLVPAGASSTYTFTKQ